MKKLFLSLVVVSMTIMFNITAVNAQESPFHVGVDIWSRYVWRGTDFGSSPSVQPCIEYSTHGFTIGSWGAYTTSLNAPAQEADLYLAYTFANDMFKVIVTDYFFPTDGGLNQYFNYKNGETGHYFEGGIAFNGTEKLPLKFFAGTMFYGNDLDHAGDNRFSTYLELSYNPMIKGTDFSVFLGANLTAASDDDLNYIDPITLQPAPVSGFYGDKAGLCRVGISAAKKIQITDSFELPLTVMLQSNPMKGNLFLTAGFTF